MIYRAIAYSNDPAWPGKGSYERVVYLEAANHFQADMRIKGLLAAVWAVAAESIEYYNLKSELELIAESIGAADTGDQRLLEMGSSNGEPIYGESSSHPLFLLDSGLNRMMAAYLTLPHFGASGLRFSKGLFGESA